MTFTHWRIAAPIGGSLIAASSPRAIRFYDYAYAAIAEPQADIILLEFKLEE